MNQHRQGENVVSAPVCYPVDAGSNKRVTMLTKKRTGCHEDGPRDGMCIDKKCLFTPENECGCNFLDVPGDFMETSWLNGLRSKSR